MKFKEGDIVYYNEKIIHQNMDNYWLNGDEIKTNQLYIINQVTHDGDFIRFVGKSFLHSSRLFSKYKKNSKSHLPKWF